MSIQTNETNDTLTPSTGTVTVAGTVKSSSGGFTFPDNTTQTTAATGGGGAITTSTETDITGLIAGNGTNISAPTATDVTDALGYTPPNETNPVIFDALEFYGAGVTGYTPFANTMASWAVDDNNYSLFYLQNLNSGTDASADFVVYNDAADVDSYFVDMGINSSNFSSASYPIFTPNSAYLFSGGGTGALTSDLFIGTATADSDVVLFAGGVETTNEIMRVKSNGNVIIGTDPDTGETFQVSGSTHIKGATEFSSTVLLGQDPTTALQAATKQYVDNIASSGIHIHEAVYAETSAALSAVYVQGGTTFNITDITGGDTVVTSTAHGLSVNAEIWLTTTAGNGLVINTPYFVYSAPTTTSLQLSTSYGGALLTGLTNATGLSYATRANSGVGAYLESSANATFTIGSYPLTVGDRILVYQQAQAYWDGVYTITSLGSGSTKWKLTRATDQDRYAPQDTNGMGEGDYFFITTNSEAYVMTTPGALIIGYTPITYTLFSASATYTGGTNITVAGQVISVSGTIDATLGGTGTSTVTTGDLLYGSGTNTWGKLAAGAAYKSLTMNAGGTQVEWNGVALNQANAVSGQLGISNGGTGASSAATALTNLGAQATLVSGTNIKTINGSSVLGAGDLTVTGGMTLLATNTFGTAGTFTNGWTKDANAKLVIVYAIGAGAGGASGGASANTSYGGTGGGSAGAVVRGVFPAVILGGTETITVGAKGTGGASVSFTAAGANGGVVGNPGNPGGDSKFGAWLTAEGGNPGTVNTNNGSLLGGGAGMGVVAGFTIPIEAGGAGTDASATDNNPQATTPALATSFMSSGGGAGGSVGATTGAINGTTGATAGTITGGTAGTGATSTTGTATGTAGGNGSNNTAVTQGSGGGGGGNAVTSWSNAASRANGGAGGNGGVGAGGGGGGAARVAVTAGAIATSGKGGDGGDGFVIIYQYG